MFSLCFYDCFLFYLRWRMLKFSFRNLSDAFHCLWHFLNFSYQLLLYCVRIFFCFIDLNIYWNSKENKRKYSNILFFWKLIQMSFLEIYFIPQIIYIVRQVCMLQYTFLLLVFLHSSKTFFFDFERNSFLLKSNFYF